MSNQNSNSISRRNFLKSSAMIGTGVAAGALAGCTQQTGTPAQKWDKEVDVLVAGSGTVAYAALAAKEAGAASVLIIEKGPAFGGTSALSGGGFWLPNNLVMKEKGIADSKEDALKYIKGVAEGQSTDELMNTYLDNAPKFAEWMRDKYGVVWGTSGTSFKDYYQTPGYRKDGRTIFASKDGKSIGGKGTWEMLRGLCDKLGIEVMLETPAKKLVTNTAGEVIGVIASKDGKDYAIKAKKGVILGTGGFDFNKDMTTGFLRGPIFASNAVPTNTGDGHLMGMAIGADLRNMNESWGLPAFVTNAEKMQGDMDWQMYRGKPGAVVVNKHGERIGNEASSYELFQRSFYVYDSGLFEWRNIPSYWICDSTYMVNYAMPGSGFKMGVVPDWMKKADTLEELCKTLGVKPENFMLTIKAFNENAKNGIDPVWHRGEYDFDKGTAGDLTGKRTELKNNCLSPLEKGPFYGAPYYPGTCGTSGGLRCNANAQVINVWGQVIPRLYVIGNTAGSVMGASYPGGGATLGAGAVFGMLAGKHAAALTAQA